MRKRRRYGFWCARFLRPGYAGLIAFALVCAIALKAFDALGGTDAAAGIFGGLIGAKALDGISVKWLKIVFGAVIIVTAVKMII